MSFNNNNNNNNNNNEESNSLNWRLGGKASDTYKNYALRLCLGVQSCGSTHELIRSSSLFHTRTSSQNAAFNVV
jgi:hypothetical protein